MKDSGVEWIGDIPEEWEVINPKALFRLRKEKAALGQRQLTSSQQYGIVYQDEYMKLTGAKVVTVEKDFEILKQVESGDFVISMRSFQGGIEYSPYSGSISSAYVMLIPNKNCVYSPFYKWLLKSSEYIRALQSTSNMVRDGQAMRYSNFAQVRLIVLPMEEQRRIANYLDSKCAEIDKVVEQTRATIEEYKKLKQAIITDAVTKGVRGPRPMKPSGVEWIGDIPEEWEVRKVSQFWKANKGPNAAQLTAEYCGNHPGEYPVYSGQTENNGVMGMIDSYSFDFGERGCLFSTTVGAKAMTVSCLYNKFSLSQNCMIMQPLSEKCDVRYYFYLFAFIFGYFRSLIPDYMQPSFRVKDFLSYCMLLPSVIEQQEIATYLDTKCAEIDLIIQKKEQLIEELGSYKKSLIYEYVTGKKEIKIHNYSQNTIC